MAEGFIGDFPDRSDEVLCMNRSRRGIDHQHTIVADDDAGVGNAPVGYPRSASLGVGVYVRRELLQLGLPARHLREFRVRSRRYHRGRCRWRRCGLCPKVCRTALTCQSYEKHESRTHHANDRLPTSEPCSLRFVRLRHEILLESPDQDRRQAFNYFVETPCWETSPGEV